MNGPKGSLKSPTGANHSTQYDKTFAFLNLTRFPPIEKIDNFQSLSFEGNPISSFKTLPKLRSLRKLCMDNTKIQSFQDCVSQPKLSSVSFFNTQIEKYEYLELMCSIAFGNRIRRVNGKSLTAEQLNFANETRSILKPYLKKGYILKSLDPPVLINYFTNEKKTFSSRKKKRISNNGENQTNIQQSPIRVYQNSANLIKREKRWQRNRRNKSADTKHPKTSKNTTKNRELMINTQIPFKNEDDALLTDDMLIPDHLKPKIRSKSIPKPTSMKQYATTTNTKSSFHKKPPPLLDDAPKTSDPRRGTSNFDNKQGEEGKIIQKRNRAKTPTNTTNKQNILNNEIEQNKIKKSKTPNKLQKSEKKGHSSQKHQTKQQEEKEPQVPPPPLEIPDQSAILNLSKQMEMVEITSKPTKKRSKSKSKKRKHRGNTQNREIQEENVDNQIDMNFGRDSVSVLKEKKKPRRRRNPSKGNNNGQNNKQDPIPGILEFGSIKITQCMESSESEDLFKKTFTKKKGERKTFIQQHQEDQAQKNRNTSQLKDRKANIEAEANHTYSTEFKITSSSTNLSQINPPSKVLPQMHLPEQSGIVSLEIEDIIQPPKGANIQLLQKGKNKETDEESFTLGTLFSTIDLLSPRNKRTKHTKAPRLSFDPAPITCDEDNTPSSFNGKITREDAYRAFYMSHKNEISTPEEVEQFIYQYMKKMNRR